MESALLEILLSFPNHGFKDGEVIHYSSDDTAITGLSTTAQYQVLTIDDNSLDYVILV